MCIRDSQYTNVYFKLLTMVDPEAKAKAKARKATLKLYPSPKNWLRKNHETLWTIAWPTILASSTVDQPRHRDRQHNGWYNGWLFLWYCLEWPWKAGNYLGTGIEIVFILFWRRVLDGKLGLSGWGTSRAQSSWAERNKAAILYVYATSTSE